MSTASKWTKTSTLRELKRMGTAQNRKVYARHGVTGPAFGVSYANQGKLRKAIGTDHALALELWKTGNHDARVLATFVADPAALDRKTLDGWVKDLDSYVITDAFSAAAAGAPSAVACATRWTKSRGEWASSAGWNLVNRLAEDAEALAAKDLEGLLETIEAKIHGAPNRTRYAMNGALIAIGLRPGLTAKAKAAARRIGAVEVDHGETGCKTPDAASYIDKTLAHRKTKRRPARKA